MENENINFERIVKNVLKKSTVPEPSDDFTMNVMSNISQINPGWIKTEQSLISRKGWFIIGITVALVITFIIIVSNIYNVESARQITYLQNYNQIINSINMQLSKMLSQIKLPFWLPLGLLFIILALFIESVFRKIFRIN
ncbi:MAG: hypothetical protein EPN82_11355 [Bacteroidetes bacterium]|nr:MAG: hypothetical protein EPN82_11355 [Bacteroidota bacterium]